jgi:hypothetical protein
VVTRWVLESFDIGLGVTTTNIHESEIMGPLIPSLLVTDGQMRLLILTLSRNGFAFVKTWQHLTIRYVNI